MIDSVSPKVSVCIPVFNGSDYIAESINSVLAQTYEDFQLIVCDNCSTDNTEEIVRGFRDPRLKYVRNAENLGLVGNFNRCLELAKGEYVCIWHHDDVMLPDNLEFKVRLLDEHPDVGFVHSNLILIDNKGEVVAPEIWNEDSRRDYIENGLPVFYRYLDYLSAGRGASIFVGAVLARRKCYEELGDFCPELPHCLDSEMWMRMMLFYKIACIGTPLVRYRVHPESASSSWGDRTSIYNFKEHYLAAMMIFDRYKEHIPQSNNLKRRIFLSFAERAIHLAVLAIRKGEYDTGKVFYKEGVKISPWIFKNPYFWKVTGGLAVGPTGIKLYQSVKKAFATNDC